MKEVFTAIGILVSVVSVSAAIIYGIDWFVTRVGKRDLKKLDERIDNVYNYNHKDYCAVKEDIRKLEFRLSNLSFDVSRMIIDTNKEKICEIIKKKEKKEK